jgi:hypothetical protein
MQMREGVLRSDAEAIFAPRGPRSAAPAAATGRGAARQCVRAAGGYWGTHWRPISPLLRRIVATTLGLLLKRRVRMQSSEMFGDVRRCLEVKAP